MKANTNDNRTPSEPDKVDAYTKAVKHPLKKVIEALRQIILDADPGDTSGFIPYWPVLLFFSNRSCLRVT